MVWKDLSYWLRGGIKGVILASIIILGFFCFTLIFGNVENLLDGIILMIIVNALWNSIIPLIVIFFIVGALIALANRK